MRKQVNRQRAARVAWALLVAVLSAGAAAINAQQRGPSSPPDKLIIEGKQLGVRVSPKPGDLCLIDGKPLRPGDPVYLIVNGYRIPLHWPDCYRQFIRSPRKWLSRLEPGGGAFLGAEAGAARADWMWVWMGLYVLLGLIFAGLGSQRALERGYPPAVGFALGFVLNIAGYVILTMRPRRAGPAPAGVPAGLRKIHTTYSPRRCPVCGFPNHPAANACIHCGAELKPQVVSEVSKVRSNPRTPEN